MARERNLIVDDVALNILILENTLSKEYDVATASTGEEALEMVEPFAPDIILLDVMMPGIGGFETCRRIRASSGPSSPKIILVSAMAMHDDIQQGMESGADDYLPKPFKGAEVRARIHAQLHPGG